MEIITRDDAQSAGLMRYWTGKPCRKGHLSERYVSNKICITCSYAHAIANRGKYVMATAAWREKNSEVFNEKARIRANKWRLENLEKSNQRCKKWSENNKVRLSVYQQEYREKNRIELNRKANDRKIGRRLDPIYRLKGQLGTLIRNSIKKKGFLKTSRTAEILGCSWPEFAAHLERQFLPGMSWLNRSLWHVDHIIPTASVESEADVLALNHFTNLRPMWAADNIKKSDKVLFLI